MLLFLVFFYIIYVLSIDLVWPMAQNLTNICTCQPPPLNDWTLPPKKKGKVLVGIWKIKPPSHNPCKNACFQPQVSHEQNLLAFHSTGCLRRILIMVYKNNPHISYVEFHPLKQSLNNQIGAPFLHCSRSVAFPNWAYWYSACPAGARWAYADCPNRACPRWVYRADQVVQVVQGQDQ